MWTSCGGCWRRSTAWAWLGVAGRPCQRGSGNAWPWLGPSHSWTALEADARNDRSAALTVSAPAEERYLLLDEPTSSLDPAHQHLAMHLLRGRAGAGIGVLAVVHDLNLAAAYADRLVLLRGGRVAALGTPAQVLQPDLLEQVFDIPMLVLPHPARRHPLVIPDPRPAS